VAEQIVKAAEKTYRKNKENRRTTAQQLKISESTLYRKHKEYGFATD
jgi:transcriptional regulator with PAS, ATPase and Fis domain